MDENNFPILPCDVVLMRGKRSDPLIMSQRVVSGKINPEFTHIAISIGGGAFIHADGKSVTLVPYYKLFNTTDYHDTWEVYRNKQLQNYIINGVVDFSKLQAVCLYFLGQGYNWLFGVKKITDNRKFCSELAASIYNILGIEIFKKSPEKVFPYHFQALRNNSKWIDITKTYIGQYHFEKNKESTKRMKSILESFSDPKSKEFLNDLSILDEDKIDNSIRRNADVMIEMLNKERNFSIEMNTIDNQLQLLIDTKKLDSKLTAHLRNIVTNHESLIKFWDTNKKL